MDLTDELPELETAALEDMDPGLPPEVPAVAMQPQALSNPFDDPLPSAPAAQAAPKNNDTLSVNDLKDDILGGVDFDIPPAGAAGATGLAAKSIVSTAPTPRVAAPSAPAPSFGGFKPATPAFASGAVPKPFGSGSATTAPPVAPALAVARPAAAAAKPAEALFDTSELAASDPATLKEALTSDTPVGNLPPEALKLAFQLCRVLVKKGIISVDDLLA